MVLERVCATERVPNRNEDHCGSGQSGLMNGSGGCYTAKRLTKRVNGGLAMAKENRPITMIQRTSDRGFSLPEVLLAVTLLSIGMLGSGVLASGVIKATKVSKDVTVATVLAQDGMEAIRNAGYSGLPSDDTLITEDYGSLAGYHNFRRVTRIQCDLPAVGMKTVSVSVYRRTSQSPIVFTTIVSD